MVGGPARRQGGVMSTNPSEAPQQPPQDPSGPPRPEPTDLGSLRRSRNDRHIAGVAGGLARHLGIDPIIIRVAFVVLAFFGGAGVLLYVGAWLLVPEEDTGEAIVRLDDRSRSFLLYVVGAVAALALLGNTIGHFRLPWGLMIGGIAIVAILGNIDRLRMWSRERHRPDEYAGPAGNVYDTPLGTAGGFAPEPPAAPAAPDAGPTAPRGYVPPDYSAYTAKVTTDVQQRMRQKVQRYESRRRGPLLFWFTVALIIVAQGALGIIDLAGAHVAGAAYPALALGVIGLMLVLGAFWGRAGGLILIGLLTSVVLVGAVAADQWGLDSHSRSVTYTPASTSLVEDSYHLGTGELVVDLSRVSDPAALAGREIEVSAHVGTIEVIVPSGLNVDASGRVRGPGAIDLFGQQQGGISTSFSSSTSGSGPTDAAPLTIDAAINVGKITVETR